MRLRISIRGRIRRSVDSSVRPSVRHTRVEYLRNPVFWLKWRKIVIGTWKISSWRTIQRRVREQIARTYPMSKLCMTLMYLIMHLSMAHSIRFPRVRTSPEFWKCKLTRILPWFGVNFFFRVLEIGAVVVVRPSIQGRQNMVPSVRSQEKRDLTDVCEKKSIMNTCFFMDDSETGTQAGLQNASVFWTFTKIKERMSACLFN